MRELTFNEVEVVSGARGMRGGYYGRTSSVFDNFSMSNGGNWGNTWTQTGIGFTTGFSAAAPSRNPWAIGVSSLAGAFGGFFSSFTYSW